jgi:hypothetical protein
LEVTRQWVWRLATAGGLAEIAAGVLGTAATWVASTGSRAAGTEVQTPRLVGACERQARAWFFGGRAALLGLYLRGRVRRLTPLQPARLTRKVIAAAPPVACGKQLKASKWVVVAA